MAAYIRVTADHQLQTPTLCFVHPKTDQVVTVIGTSHIGTAAYFKHLQSSINTLCLGGAVVHAEGSGLLTDPGAPTPEEAEVLDSLQRCNQLVILRSAQNGWTHQLEGLRYPAHWQIRDLTVLEIVRRIGLPTMHRMARQKLRGVDWPDTDPTGPHRFWVMTMLALRSGTSERAATALAKTKAMQVLLHERNKVALDGVFVTDEDVVLVWGGMHVRGIVAGLRERGFEPSGTPEWTTVMNLPPRSAVVRRVGLIAGLRIRGLAHRAPADLSRTR
jgi:hypothetical protein